MQQLNIVWLRNDLRSFDNAVLVSAIEDAVKTQAPVLALYIATPDTWQLHDMAPIKQDFIRRRVVQLQQELAALNIPLLAVEGSSYQQVPEVFNQFAQQFSLKVLVQNEYELREQQRDKAVEQMVLAVHCFVGNVADAFQDFAGQHAVRAGGAGAGFQLVLQSGNTDFEELVHVAGKNQQEVQPFHQRMALVTGLLQHAQVELQQAELPVDVVIRFVQIQRRLSC